MHKASTSAPSKDLRHIMHSDAQRLLPFDTYNMFYRGNLEYTQLTPRRERTLLEVKQGTRG